MDYIWSPWRYRYLETAGTEKGCIFCDALAAGDDAATGIVMRGSRAFVILNRYPYTTGHVMVVPYAHGGELKDCAPETLGEIMQLARLLQGAIEAAYHPQGYNLGMNLGRAAGAGVTDHIHMHVLPRWAGDSNFMTTISETRVQPEELPTTYEKLRRALGM